MKWSNQTSLTGVETFGVGEMTIDHPPGSFPVTPATRVALQAIGTHQEILSGHGIDWGCGSGPLTIAAARVEAVEHVWGMDILPENVESSQRNARTNMVAEKTQFIVADSFVPVSPEDRSSVNQLKGKVNFIIANTPASVGDDGFGFRRRVLREACEYLVDGGLMFLNVSIQYGRHRIKGLTDSGIGLTHVKCLASTDWVPFDLQRSDLLECLQAYVEEEQRGGTPYEFNLGSGDEFATAKDALTHFQETGSSPLTKWQMRLFRYGGES